MSFYRRSLTFVWSHIQAFYHSNSLFFQGIASQSEDQCLILSLLFRWHPHKLKLYDLIEYLFQRFPYHHLSFVKINKPFFVNPPLFHPAFKKQHPGFDDFTLPEFTKVNFLPFTNFSQAMMISDDNRSDSFLNIVQFHPVCLSIRYLPFCYTKSHVPSGFLNTIVSPGGINCLAPTFCRE